MDKKEVLKILTDNQLTNCEKLIMLYLLSFNKEEVNITGKAMAATILISEHNMVYKLKNLVNKGRIRVLGHKETRRIVVIK